MPAHKKQVRGKSHSATKKVVSAKKSAPPAKAAKAVRVEPPPPAKSSGDMGAHVRRLTGEVETLKAELRKRPGGTGQEASSRRDLDKILADRLARFDGLTHVSQSARNIRSHHLPGILLTSDLVIVLR